jgi:hypothetical protein
VSHSLNVTPMSDGLLRGLDSAAFLGQGHDHQKCHRNVPADFKAGQLAVCFWMVPNFGMEPHILVNYK